MHLARAAAPLFLLSFAVAACTGSAAPAVYTTASTPGSAASAPAAVSPTTEAAAPSTDASGGSGTRGYGYSAGGGSASPAGAADAGIALATTSLGTVLVGPGGRTLYVFLADSGGTSACNGQCTSNWPPLTGALPALGAGLAAGDFGSISRGDGTKQVTFHGRPLYNFAGDQAAGQTNGQGIGGKWYVVGGDGTPIK